MRFSFSFEKKRVRYKWRVAEKCTRRRRIWLRGTCCYCCCRKLRESLRVHRNAATLVVKNAKFIFKSKVAGRWRRWLRVVLFHKIAERSCSRGDNRRDVLLQGGYPAKLKKVLIVTAPLWFKAPFKILRLFVREKLRDRVYTVSVPQVGTDEFLAMGTVVV